MLSDSSHEIRQQADSALSEFLQEIKNSPVRFLLMFFFLSFLFNYHGFCHCSDPNSSSMSFSPLSNHLRNIYCSQYLLNILQFFLVIYLLTVVGLVSCLILFYIIFINYFDTKAKYFVHLSFSDSSSATLEVCRLWSNG